MNKLTIAILTTIITGAAQAEFTVKIPIQQNNVTFYSWITTDPILGEWENTGDIHSCSNWSPSPSDITLGQSFTQTATDCKQNQIRTVQDRQIDELSGSIRNIGELYAQTQVITVNSSQEAVGTKEAWVATTPTYSAWVNSGALTSCTNWSPATSTVASGQSFTQTATDCKQAQTRSRQNREQETTTKAIRNVGSPITEAQNITVSSTRTATGTKVTKECLYDINKYTWSHLYTNSTMIRWNGQTLYDNEIYGTRGYYSSMNIGGYKYSRGVQRQDYPWIYHICREAL